MPLITLQAVTEYLTSLLAKPVRVISMTEEGKQETSEDLKAYG